MPGPRTLHALVALAALALGSPSGASVRMLPCTPEDASDVAALEAEAWLKTRDALAGALQASNLTRIGGPRQLTTTGKGLTGTGGHAPGEVVRTGAGWFVAGPAYWSGLGAPPEHWAFVRRGDVIYRLITVAEREVYATVRLCGCAPRSCGPYNSGCPACHPMVQPLYGPFPEDATWGGTEAVHHVAYAVDREYADVCARRACPPPPP